MNSSDFFLSPGGFLGAVVGLAVAAVIRWMFPSLADSAVILFAGLVAAGFLIGVIFDNRSDRR